MAAIRRKEVLALAGITMIMKRGEVEAATGLCYTSIFNKMRAGTFPLSRELTGRSKGWIKEEVYAWIASLPCTVFPAALA